MILLLSFDVRRQGGIERLTCQVLSSLKNQGQQVRLLTPRRLGPGAVGRLLGRARFLLELAWFLPQCSSILSMHVLLLRPLAWLQPLRSRPQPLRCWIHGIEVWGEAAERLGPLLRRCDQLIASSHVTRARLLEGNGPWPPISVVHPMADLIDPSQPNQPLPPALRLLTVARMDRSEQYKGHELVLQALRLLLQNGQLPDQLRWQVVGSGDVRGRLESLSQEWGLQHWVCFLGSLSDADLEGELRHCSVMVMPSAYGIQSDGRACGEGFGIVYLEAAQAWRASIACRQGGQSDLIVDGENGWLIEPRADALATLLHELATSADLLASAGAAAHSRAQTSFSAQCFQAKLATSLGLNPGSGGISSSSGCAG